MIKHHTIWNRCNDFVDAMRAIFSRIIVTINRRTIWDGFWRSARAVSSGEGTTEREEDRRTTNEDHSERRRPRERLLGSGQELMIEDELISIWLVRILGILQIVIQSGDAMKSRHGAHHEQMVCMKPRTIRWSPSGNKELVAAGILVRNWTQQGNTDCRCGGSIYAPRYGNSPCQ